VVRGGSFINNDDNVRCAYRNRNSPGDRNNNVGFRVVAHGLHPNLAAREGSVFSVGYGWRCANEGRCSRILAAPGQPGRASTEGVCAPAVSGLTHGLAQTRLECMSV